MKKRVIFDVMLLGVLFFTPWWFVAIVAFWGAFLWPFYYEIILVGFLIDLLYGGMTLPLRGILGVLGATAMYFMATYARRIVR